MDNALSQELLLALKRRITAAEHGDFSALFDQFASDETVALVAMLDSRSPQTAALFAEYHWLRYQATAPEHGSAELTMAIRLVARVPPELRENVPEPLRLLATIDPDASGDYEDWYRQMATSLNDDLAPEALDEVIGVLTLIHDAATGEFQLRVLAALAVAHFRRLDNSSDPAHHNAAIVVGKQVEITLPTDHPQRWILLFNLALLLRQRFSLTQDPDDLDAAITASRAAVQANPSSAVVRSGLAIALRTRHGLTGGPEDLAGAVDHCQTAVRQFADDDPERPITLAHLASALLTRAAETGAVRDLHDALGYARAAADLPGERHRAHASHVLVDVLKLRFDRTKQLVELLELEHALRDVIATGGPEKFRSQLAHTLAFRFNCTQDTRHLDEAVEILRDLAGSGRLAARRRYTLGLAAMMCDRAEVTGSVEDLVDGIMCILRAVAKSPDTNRPELAPLRARLTDYARTGDADVLLDPTVLLEVEQLLALDGFPPDLEIRSLAGWVLWLRTLNQGEHVENETRAVNVLYPVYLSVPDAVPEAIAEYLRDDEAASVEKNGTMVEGWRHNVAGVRLLETFYETGDPRALHAGIRQLRQAVGTVAEKDQAAAYNNLALALAQFAGFGGDREVVMEAEAAARQSVKASAPDDRYLPGRLSLLCGILNTLGGQSADLDLIREAKRVGEQGVALTPADHPSRGLHMANLCATLVTEYQHVRDTTLLRNAVDRFRETLPLLPPGHRHGVTAQCSFVSALRTLAEATDRVEPLREAEQILSRVLENAQGAQRVLVLDSLTRTLNQVYTQTKDQSALVKAVASGRELIAITAPEDPELLLLLTNFASQCALLFAHTKDEAILDEGIEHLRYAQSIAGPDDPELRGSQMLTELLGWKAEDTGDTSFLEEADRVSHQAIRSRPRQAGLLADRAHVLSRLHRMTGRLGALRSSIEVGLEALSRTELDDPNREDRGRTVIEGLRSLYELTGDRGALERGITLARAELADDPAADSYWRLALATMLDSRGAPEVEEAEKVLRGYLEAIPTNHPQRRQATSGLGLILLHRYQLTGALAFLQEAIALFRANAPERYSDASDFLGSLAARNSLALSLNILYQRTGDPAALAEAIEVGRGLVSSAPVGYSYRSVYLGNLADYLVAHWRVTADATLLSEVVDLSRAAVVAAGSDLAYRADNQIRLAQLLLEIARQTGDEGLVVEAVNAADQAASFSDDSHPNRAVHLAQFGSALIRQGVTGGDKIALAKARDVLSRAAVIPQASVGDRIRISERWADAAMHLGDPHEAERAYRHAIDLMVERVGPAIAWMDREHGINEAGALPGNAAAAAIAAGHPWAAVTLLEQSRGVLLAEALHTHIDVGVLEEHSPDLAEDFHRVHGELRSLDLQQPDLAGNGITPNWITQRRLDLGREWPAICERIREVPGFDDFLLPPTLSAIQDATRGGTMVIVNVSTWRCDALLVTKAGVESVSLPELSADDCVAQITRYLDVIQDHEDAVQALIQARCDALNGNDAAAYQRYDAAKSAVSDKRSAVDDALTGILAWLWDTVAQPVVEHLRLDQTSQHRLWWCPIGPLTLLPLHAAGHPGDQKRCLSNLVVSSYAPTLRALVRAHRSHTEPDGGMLVVAMPRTPGQAPLPHAARERDHLRSLFPMPSSTVLSDTTATCDNVIGGLASHRWVHFSCHGQQIMDAPADSHLSLADGPLTVARLIAERPSGEFAFLSACDTAASGVTVLNETITLAAALHYAGYRHVIATLWSVLDSVAADVAVATYDALTATEQFEPAGAAQALHAAVHRLRTEYPDQPSLWIPFVHIGI